MALAFIIGCDTGTQNKPMGFADLTAAPKMDTFYKVGPDGKVTDTVIQTTTTETVSYPVVTTVVKPVKPGTTNQPPTARAGSDQIITLPVNTTQLNGSQSSDPENQIKSYGWRKVAGPTTFTLTDTNKAIATVTNLVKGVYDFELRVVDAGNLFKADTVRVTVQEGTVTPPQSSYNISTSIIPTTAADFSAPFRGAEQWHDRQDVNLGYSSQDVYWRFVATRIATATRGQYNWSYLDNLFNQAISKRQKISFGIMTSYPEGTTDNGLISIGGGTAAYPAWLQSAMNGEWLINGSWVPNYNDATYLAWCLELNKAIDAHIKATSFNGVRYSDIVNSIDIRSYGSWGEWHSANLADQFTVSQYPSGTFPTEASLKKIVDAYVQGFPDFQLHCMIAAFDAQWLNNTWNPPGIAYYVLTQRNNKGLIGWRRDQWGATDSYLRDYLENNNRSYNGLVFKDSIMVRYKSAPITGEPPSWIPNDYADLVRQINLYHANSFGNGNYGTNSPNLTIQARVKEASKAAGYRLLITGGKVDVSGQTLTVGVDWRNVGLAPNYENWDVIYQLVGGGQTYELGKSNFKIRLFQPNLTTSTRITESFQTMAPAGTYELRVIIKDPTNYRAPLPLALNGRNSDGSYTLVTGVVK